MMMISVLSASIEQSVMYNQLGVVQVCRGMQKLPAFIVLYLQLNKRDWLQNSRTCQLGNQTVFITHAHIGPCLIDAA